MADQCVFIKVGGERCRTTTNLSPDNLCQWHDPARQEKATEARRKGGRSSALKHRKVAALEDTPSFEPDTLEHLALWHQWAGRAAATGAIDARTSDSICRHLKELRPALVNLDLEKRLKAAERALATARKESQSRG